MRVPWRGDFPKVLVNAAWESDTDFSLPDHPAYWPAKRKRDAKAAVALCEDVVSEENLEILYDLTYGTQPLVVAPALTLHETQMP
jgi:hypothetical protein